MCCPTNCNICDQGNMENCPNKVVSIDSNSFYYNEIKDLYLTAIKHPNYNKAFKTGLRRAL